jgi:hypothetical protein
MSLNGQTQTYMPPTLDGLNIVEADQIYVNGVELDPTNLVTYTGATKALDMNNKAIKTTYTPIVNADVVNLLTLNQATGGTVGYVDEYFVPYNNATSDTNLGNKNLTVTNAGQVSFSNIVKTELNNVLSGYNPASITVGNDFGAITNAAGVYQSTSTAAFASLVLGAPPSGEKYIVSLSLKSVDPGNVTNLYLYGSTTPNMSGSTGQIVAFSIPANTTGFTVFTNTITFPVGSTYLLLVYYSQKPSGIDTLYWNAFSLTGMGSVVKNLIAPTTSLDGANKGYVDTQDALRVPYTGASANLQLGGNSLIATTAQFTGVTSATPALALGVDGSGNLRSFAVPTATNLLPLNNDWTGTNTFNNNVVMADKYTTNVNNAFASIQPQIANETNFATGGTDFIGTMPICTLTKPSTYYNLGGAGSLGMSVGLDLGYTGGSFTAGASTTITGSWTANTVSNRIATITFDVTSHIGKSLNCVWEGVTPLVFATSPPPFFTVVNGSTTVYSSPQPISGTNTYAWNFTPTVGLTTITYTVQSTGTPSLPAFSWTRFSIKWISPSYLAYKPGAKYSATFTNLLGSQNMSFYVYQYNVGGTSGVPIGDVFAIPITTSGQTITVTFTPNSLGTTGTIIFFFQPTSANQYVRFDTAVITRADMTISGNIQSALGVISTIASSNPTGNSGNGTNINISAFNGAFGSIEAFNNANTTKLPIGLNTYGGYVGVGNGYPTGTFDIQGIIRMGNYTAGNYDNIEFQRGTLEGEYPNIRCQDNYIGMYVSTAAGWCTDSQVGDLVIKTGLNRSFRVAYNGTSSSLVCHSSRNVGIGIATPIYKLDIAGNLRVASNMVVQNGNDSFCYYGPNTTWGATLAVGSGTDKGVCQVFCTDGNLHLDCLAGKSIYLGYHNANPVNIFCYASSTITNYTRYFRQYGAIDADAHAYFVNQSGGASAYFNLIVATNAGNTNHFMNSTTRTGDGGIKAYTIRNDTNGGVRFMSNYGGFSSYGYDGSGGANTCNAVINYTNTTNGNIGSWTGQGYTLFCNNSQPSGSQAALGIGCQNYLNNFITSLSPGVRWMDLYMYAANTYLYCNGSLCAYSYSGGWANISDAREKEDINDLKTSRSLERIMSCKPKYYKRKYYDTDKDGKEATPIPQSVKDIVCVGLLAQDVLQHTPHCVSGWKNENIKETDDDDAMRFGINYGDFTVHLIGAVQEQQKQMDDLKNKLEKSQQDFDDYKKTMEARFDKLADFLAKSLQKAS